MNNERKFDFLQNTLIGIQNAYSRVSFYVEAPLKLLIMI